MTQPTDPAAAPDPAAHEARLKRLRFRAWHRGTREADYMIGGFFDVFHAGWNEAELVWFETLIEEEDVDILGWALGSLSVPEEYRGAMMERMQKLDYVDIPR
ncbi:MAG TPA: succinate dehydrogenase assembly factor 2 [Novosphingobium sp.]|nr:succinate dehydrogenase assembly factor 2 [Novosphingobium sp.]